MKGICQTRFLRQLLDFLFLSLKWAISVSVEDQRQAGCLHPAGSSLLYSTSFCKYFRPSLHSAPPSLHVRVKSRALFDQGPLSDRKPTTSTTVSAWDFILQHSAASASYRQGSQIISSSGKLITPWFLLDIKMNVEWNQSVNNCKNNKCVNIDHSFFHYKWRKNHKEWKYFFAKLHAGASLCWQVLVLQIITIHSGIRMWAHERKKKLLNDPIDK